MRVYGWRGARNTAAVGPDSTARPRYMTSTRSHNWRTTARLWLTNTMPVPRSRLMAASNSRICAWMETSSELTASSHTSSLGSSTMARAMATRWHWPPDNSRLRRCGELRAEPDTVEHGAHARRALGRRRARAQGAQRLGHDVGDALQRIEAGHRILEHHLHSGAHAAQLLAGEILDGLSQPDDLAAGDVVEAQQRTRQR